MKKLILPIVIGVFMMLIGVLGGHSFSGWMGAALLAFAALMWFVASSRNSGRVAEGKEWLGRFPGVKYGFAYGEYGIAVDAANDVIQLKDAGRAKSYPFADIRSWRTNLQSGGMSTYVGGGAVSALGVIGSNSNQAKANDKATGLFVTMKDVDKPVWRIRFSDNEQEEEQQQSRWLEILTQTVNKT